MELATLYVGGGLLGGFAFGLALPLARSLSGSVVVGMLAVSPFFIAQAFMQAKDMDGAPIYDALLMIALFGVGGGYAGWTHFGRAKDAPD